MQKSKVIISSVFFLHLLQTICLAICILFSNYHKRLWHQLYEHLQIFWSICCWKFVYFLVAFSTLNKSTKITNYFDWHEEFSTGSTILDNDRYTIFEIINYLRHSMPWLNQYLINCLVHEIDWSSMAIISVGNWKSKTITIRCWTIFAINQYNVYNDSFFFSFQLIDHWDTDWVRVCSSDFFFHCCCYCNQTCWLWLTKRIQSKREHINHNVDL